MSFNEEKNIINTIKDVLKNLSISKYSYEIIIMDDGSYDNTKLTVLRFLSKKNIYKKYIKYKRNSKNLGQFKNIQRGVFFSKFDNICIIPGDGQVLMKNFLDNFKLIDKNTVFYGCPINEIQGRGKFRMIVSHLWRILLKILFDIRAVYLAGLIIIPKKIFNLIDVKAYNFFGLYEHGIAINQSRINITQGFFYLKKREFGDSTSLSLKMIILAPLFLVKVFLKYKKQGIFPEGLMIKNLDKKLKKII